MSDIVHQTAAKSARQPQASAGALQRKCACGNQPRAGHECADCARKREAVQRRALDPNRTRDGRPQDPSPRSGHNFSNVRVRRSPLARVQPRLLITSSCDEYEQEADRIADLVCGASLSNASLVSDGGVGRSVTPLRISPFVQREGPDDAETRDDAESPAVELALMRRAGAGQALPPSVRERMEDRFGVRFGAVRVHTGTDAERLADDIDALAFTHGRHIYFSTGAYAPGTAAGDRLLAHELTHVVQQSGGLATSGPAVQRFRIRGPAFHEGTEKRFVAANKGKGLITEAPLPGGTESARFDFEKVGFPDLYRSDMANTAIGVRGQWQKPKDVNPSDAPDKKPGFTDLHNFERTAKSESGGVTYSPKPQGDAQPFTSEFPNKIEVGDIKPVWMVRGKVIVEGPGTGTKQLGNYQEGVKEFVRIAAAEKKVTRATIASTSVLSGLTIPAELDYKNFEKENKTPSPNIIQTRDITGPRRYWIFEPPGTGLYYYFHLAHPNPAPEARAKLEEAFKKLEPVKKELHTPRDDGIHNKLDLPKVPKLRAARKRRPLHGERANAQARNGGVTAAIQRRDTPRPKKDWNAAGEAWEKKRATWDQEYAKPFLASKEAKALDERVSIDSAIGLKHDTTPGSFGEMARHFKAVELWSGLTGKALGFVRFKLGIVFDKISAAFEWIKGKFTGFSKKIASISTTGVSGTWEKTLVDVLMKGLKLGFQQLVSVFFELCANCLEGIIHKVVDRFTEDISEELHKQIEALRTQLEKYEALLKTEFERRFGSWDRLIEDLRTLQEITSVVLGMEALIRIGLQAVACLSPPALGCLWGLVVQVGLSIALNLIMGTAWFQEHVINHPSVRGMIKRFAGPTIRSLIADTLRGIGMEDYAKDVDACNKVKELEPPPVPPVDPISPDELQKRKAQWESANRPQMLQDLQFRFHTQPGQPASEADLESLVQAIGRSGKSPEEVKKIIESTPKWSNGKYDLHAIRKRLIPVERSPSAAGGSGIVSSKDLKRPGPRIDIGPKVFEAPPGSPPGSGGQVAPGAGISF